ncbi:hypothetical protein CDO52_14325 [Nocardiopsis gilva YIM 90087]|uniref:SWIM-type domain-containing protein n=1 Tax=Nocardiopsis gilva YIM 90087 TaxID=1235441 RepID=A0A223SDL7_9ACTN|nr:SWIM zinc finger family protein [Nocardiopsis gilva]ASU86227.1 hypothetical protein CDO52_14325 [Nocardiopsis gilva YIM 90087]
MSERWNTDDVAALAPDASSRKAAVKVARTASWPVLGRLAADPTEAADAPGGTVALWGACAGSGKKPYQTAVHLTGPSAPASKCSCPSRKFPCKHALALLHLWVEGRVEAAGDPPDWVADWLIRRDATTERRDAAPDAEAAARRTQRREERVAEGFAELELWLRDQAQAGLAGAPGRDYGHWDGMAARLVDAQAGRVADRVRELGSVCAKDEWPGRLLTEFALLRLLITAYRRRDDLPEPLRATVRARAGLVTAPDESAPVRDTWQVLGRRDFPAGQVRGRRIWLRGRATERVAMLVSFAPTGRTPETAARVGTEFEADLAFYPAERRASLVARHAEHRADPPPGGSLDDALKSWASAVAADPWLEEWPVVVRDAAVAHRDGWWLTDPSGAALPVHRAVAPSQPWRLAAVSGGAPLTVAAEWTPSGLRPLTAWTAEGRAVPM